MSETLPTYSSWEDVPEHLKTRSALKKLGLKPKRGQPPAAVKTHWHWKTPNYDLYDVRECVPNVLTDAQKAALEKAKAASLEKRTCTRCGWVEELSKDYRGKAYLIGGLCPHCREVAEREDDREEAAQWARDLLQGSFVIFDTETTGLNIAADEFVQVAVIDAGGTVLLDTLICPEAPERMLRKSSRGVSASDIHGLTPEHVKDAPRFPQVYPALVQALTGRQVVIYNAAYDAEMLASLCERHGLEPIRFEALCAMEMYAQFVGDWSEYHGNYRWQPLLGGDHTALGDCCATLGVLREMAEESSGQAAN